MNGNFLGMTGRATPFWNLQSTRLMLVASILMSTSPLLGDGIGTSTCWEGNSAGHGDQWDSETRLRWIARPRQVRFSKCTLSPCAPSPYLSYCTARIVPDGDAMDAVPHWTDCLALGEPV